jgi:hypothetical protein
VYRAARAAQEGTLGQLLCSVEELLAVVTDTRLAVEAPQFGLDDYAGVAAFLLEQAGKRAMHP